MIENQMENARFGRQWGVIRFTEAERAARYRIRNPERGVWAAMIDRCHNPHNATYEYYGGRGITVCAAWRDSFAAFLADMGQRPSRFHTIEREKNNEGYCKSNCVWASRQTQSENRRNTLIILGKPLSVWARETGISTRTLDSRLRRGWSPERAISTPTGPLTG
jgi:hypothetical protein